MMNMESRKQHLIAWIASVNDDSLLKRLETIKKNGPEWAVEISDTEKKMLELAEKDIEAGHFHSHSQVMEEMAEYLSGQR